LYGNYMVFRWASPAWPRVEKLAIEKTQGETEVTVILRKTTVTSLKGVF